CARLMSPTW
nr:immunoglobulin heavy chain junction region [Homo sapiens]